MTERLEWATGPDALASLDELSTTPFVTSTWLEAWRAAFAPQAAWRVATARRDERVVAVLPLLEHDGG